MSRCKQRRFAFVALAMLVSFTGIGTLAAADPDLGAVLTARYHGQILALRHSFKARSQDYDSQGNPIVNGGEGSWTVYGRMDVKKVSVTSDRLVLEGDQVVFESNKKKEPLRPVHQRDHVKVTIRLDRALTSQDEALSVIGRVFALTPQDMVNAAPALWRSYLAKELQVSQDVKSEPPKGDGTTRIDLDDARAAPPVVFKLGKEVTAPRAEFAPEPEYSAFARKRRLQGTVTFDVLVDSAGKIGKIVIVHPLGLGLDEAAADTISTWRFRPAMRDGQPVACAFNIEVDFHLY